MPELVYTFIEKGGRVTGPACPVCKQFVRQGADMAEKPGEIKLSVEQKTTLLNLSLGADASEPKDKADLLYDILSNPLPVDSSEIKTLPVPLKGISRRVRSVAGAPILELLKSSGTSLSTIMAIKEYAKRSGTSAETESQAEVFLAVYYAAIAKGLLFHESKITGHSLTHLAEAFGSLTEKEWVSDELQYLFSKAREDCRARRQNG